MRLSPLIAALGLLLVSAPALADTPVITSNASRASGNLSGTIAVTNTFQSVQVKTTQRQGCFIQNNGTHTMWVYFGPIANATAASSAVLPAGGSLNCSNSGISATDQISITGTGADAFTAMIDGAPSISTASTGAGGGGGGAVTIADGADVAEGATTDAAVTSGAAGTVNAHLRTISRDQTGGGQKTQIVDGSGNVIAATSNALNVSAVQATAANFNAQVVGNAASAASDSGNPVKVGEVFNSTQPTVTTGQRVDAQADANGNLGVYIVAGAQTGADAVVNTALLSQFSGTSHAAQALRPQPTAGFVFNGTTWDRQRTDTGAATGTTAVATEATSASSAGLTPVFSAALESNHVIKASAGNLYGFSVTTGATAGFVLVVNATSAPTAGGAAVAPVACYVIAANSTLGISYNPQPIALSTGIVVVFSTSGCLTNTASTTAFISGDAK